MIAGIRTTFGAIKKTFLDWSWPPAVNLARNVVLQTLSGLEVGSLLIFDETNGKDYAFGQSSSQNTLVESKDVNNLPKVEIVVKRDTFWLRLFLYADMGFGEGYMLNDFECNDLTAFFQVCLSIPNFSKCRCLEKSS